MLGKDQIPRLDPNIEFSGHLQTQIRPLDAPSKLTMEDHAPRRVHFYIKVVRLGARLKEELHAAILIYWSAVIRRPRNHERIIDLKSHMNP